MIETAEIEVTFDEDRDHTFASVALVLRGVRFTSQGRAKRHPGDPNVPVLGEELAAARALSELSHKLVDAVAEAISEREGRPAHLAL